MQAKPLIQVRNLSLSIHGRTILDKIQLEVVKDEIFTIIGPNGAGKSCLVKCILGLLSPSSGQVIKQEGITIGYTPQKIKFDPSMPLSVKQFLMLGQKHKIDVQKSLQEVGVSGLEDSWMYALSGGELQRVLLARALSHQPDLLVLDEPAAGVDIQGQAEMYRLLAKIKSSHHCGILVVSHDLSLVMAETDKVVCLNKHVCCEGHPKTVAQDPAFRALFGAQVGGLALYQHHHDHAHDVEGQIVPDKDGNN